MTTRIVITGANSAIGRVVIERALVRDDVDLVALVRSERAAGELPPIPPQRGRVAIADYAVPDTLAAAFAQADALVHLPGLLIQTAQSSYEQANVETTRAALRAAQAARLRKIVLVSAFGADPAASNRYLRSKGEAERLVRESGLCFTVLRCPMVLACQSEGVRALVRETGQRLVPLAAGGRNRDQPLDARDLADGALHAALDPDCARGQVLELVGPESLEMRELIRRGARLRGRPSRVLPIPRGLIDAALALRERFAAGGLTREVIEVMLLEVDGDPKPAALALGLSLRPLDETLRESLSLWGVL